MTPRPFEQVDVFSASAYGGNPVAVVLDGSGLNSELMQRLTCWSNLSECTFLSPPSDKGRALGADFQVRIFCPSQELPFAGHPILGSVHAWLQAGGRPHKQEVLVECGLGLIRVRRKEYQLAFCAPHLVQSGPLECAEVIRIAQSLGISIQDITAHAWCHNGPPWRAVLLKTAQHVLDLKPRSPWPSDLYVGVVGPQPAAASTQFEVRAFIPDTHGLREDPVTGSLNGALAQWLIGAGLAPPSYVVSQGTPLGRLGRVHIARETSGEVWVGGACVSCIRGHLML